MVGIKHDQEKPDMTIVPRAAKVAIAKVLMHGAEKYGRDNWKLVEERRYLAALMRHTDAVADGEEIDPDSGMPHVWAIAANAAILCGLLEARKNKERSLENS